MPDARLTRTRATLPPDYQYGDARELTTAEAETVLSAVLRRLAATIHEVPPKAPPAREEA